VTSSGPTPAQLLGAARKALTEKGGWGPAWARAAALLARQALEDAVRRSWKGPAVGLVECPMTSQLVCLRFYLSNEEVARRTRQCWNELSTACHAHPYELEPTLPELEGWITEIENLLGALAEASV
jgi:hypothetical protein